MKKYVCIIAIILAFAANTFAAGADIAGGRISKTSGGYEVTYFITDHLGSTRVVVSQGGAVVGTSDYYPFGKRWEGANIQAPTTRWLFSGKEKQTSGEINWMDFGSRMYDDFTGRWFTHDPQSYRRPWESPYGYCLNNPANYIDPNGEIAWFVPVIIGAVIGAYSGGTIANGGQMNPFKWNYNSQTFGYMLGGAIVGGVSGYAGWAIATSGIPMANTAGIAAASLINSVGTWAYTGGQTPISISFGAFSYDFTNGTFGYLGKKGNSFLENLGYGLGALANLQDAVALFGGGTDYNINSASTNKKEGHEWWGHSSGTGDGIDISVGPAKNGWGNHKSIYDYMNPNAGGVYWDNYATNRGTWTIKLHNVNQKILQKMTTNIANGKGLFFGDLKWNLMGYSCVNHVARSLWAVGIPTLPINIHPHILNLQLMIRQLGIYSSPYLYNIP